MNCGSYASQTACVLCFSNLHEHSIRWQIKPKYLEDVKIEFPSSSSKRVGILQRKHTAFDVWNLGDDDNQEIVGEEIKGVSCLLPRKNKKGELYLGERSSFSSHRR